MASIVPVLTTINGGLLKIGTGSSTYEQALTSFEVTADTPTSTVKTVAGGPFVAVGTPVYSAVLTALQDPKTTASLMNYLNGAASTAPGVAVAFVWTQAPGTTGSVTISGNLIPLAVSFGGDVDKELTFSVTLPVVGTVTYGTAA